MKKKIGRKNATIKGETNIPIEVVEVEIEEVATEEEVEDVDVEDDLEEVVIEEEVIDREQIEEQIKEQKMDEEALSVIEEIIPVFVEEKEEIEIVPVTTKPAEAKNVKIKMRSDHRCYIGGVWYNLISQKQYTVPVNVKTILSKADLLLPL